MKVICKDKVVDLSKFETVRIKESFFRDQQGNYTYYVEAIRTEVHGGLFSGTELVTEEIACCGSSKDTAKKLVKAISEKWVEEAKSFDVGKWFDENRTVN